MRTTTNARPEAEKGRQSPATEVNTGGPDSDDRKGALRRRVNCGQPDRGTTPPVKAYPGGGRCRAAHECSPPLITDHGSTRCAHTAYPTEQSNDRRRNWDSPQLGGVPSPLPFPRFSLPPAVSPAPAERNLLMANDPRKCVRPSRCRSCGADLRRGQLMRYVPLNAAPGEPRSWVHDECAS